MLTRFVCVRCLSGGCEVEHFRLKGARRNGLQVASDLADRQTSRFSLAQRLRSNDMEASGFVMQTAPGVRANIVR